MAFEYTDYEYPNSSLVQCVLFNEDTNEVMVALGTPGAHGEEQGYLYTGVSRVDYERFVKAGSVGNHYNTKFKKNFGPGEHVGAFWETPFRIAEVKPRMVNTDGFAMSFPAASKGTPKDLTYADNAKIDEDISNNLFDLSDTRNSDGSVIEPLFDLTVARRTETVDVALRHKVVFDVAGGAKKRKYNVDASSVDEAVAVVHGIGEMLGLEFVVRKVTVYFE